MKEHKKINFYIPEGITGKQFEKFLQRSRLHFFFPRKKEVDPTKGNLIKKGIHNTKIMDKYNNNLLTKIDK
jgi:hypothetical protein